MRRVSVSSQTFSGVGLHESCESGMVQQKACHGTRRGNGGHRFRESLDVPWFPRGSTQGADRDGVRDRSILPVGFDICGCEPRITQYKVVWANISDVKAEGMGLSSSRDVKVGVILQASARIWGSVSVFDFAGGIHILDSQLMFIDESLADEALSGSAVKEGFTEGLLLHCLQCNWYTHRITCRAGL